MRGLEQLKTINSSVIVAGIIIVFLVLYFAPGVIMGIFSCGKELGKAIGDAIWG